MNKNMIPFDPEKPMVTSGIRLGTPALTTRGMKEKEMALVADNRRRALGKPRPVGDGPGCREGRISPGPSHCTRN